VLLPRSKTYTWDIPPSATNAPSRLTVATCQVPVTGGIAQNLSAMTGLIREAASCGADVTHFPECALSGYGPMDDWPNWAAFDWRALDVALDALRTAARLAGIWVVAGSVQQRENGNSPANSLLVIDREGEIVGRYDKRRCSMNDLRAFSPGSKGLILDIEGVRCGFLICLDWSFPELWQDYAGAVDLVFHSCVSDNVQRDRVEAHVIQPLLRSYAWLHSYAVSSSNSCRPRQNFSSFWIERSGHLGNQPRPDRPGFAINKLIADEEQDRFFKMVRDFRRSARQHEAG
jgi:deaminated glutathione amidase